MDKHGRPGRPTQTLPAWIAGAIDRDRVCANADAQIALAIELTRRNAEHMTGGPFGAAVFNDAGKLIAVGANRIEPLASSLAHAGIAAPAGAQRKLKRARLDDDGHRYTLTTSAQPCCRCHGAIVGAGIDELLIGARAEDTEALTGFDEGPLPANWAGEFERRGILVMRDLHRYAARGARRLRHAV